MEMGQTSFKVALPLLPLPGHLWIWSWQKVVAQGAETS